jgi:transcriptional regulator GlxA family with amidase domain
VSNPDADHIGGFLDVFDAFEVGVVYLSGDDKGTLTYNSFLRGLREQTGTTPLQWLHWARVRQAQYLLETMRHPVERLALQVGFGSPTTFRDRFKRLVGTSPQAYRRTFQGSPAR